MEYEIYNGSRGNDFKQMILNILKKGKIKQKYLDILTGKDGMKIYDQIFTTQSANPDLNYEYFETLGDVTANKFIVWYAFRKYPQLHCSEAVQILSRIKSVYGSKEIFGEIGEKLGFWPYISSSIEDRNTRKKDLNEDVFEAFIGGTEYLIDLKTTQGVGNAIMYDILYNIFEEYVPISLSYDDLMDTVTVLKQLFDKNKDWGTVDYVDEKIVNPEGGYPLTIVYAVAKTKGQHPLTLGEARGYGNKKSLKPKAAKNALQNLKSKGITYPIPEIYIRYCIK